MVEWWACSAEWSRGLLMAFDSCRMSKRESSQAIAYSSPSPALASTTHYTSRTITGDPLYDSGGDELELDVRHAPPGECARFDSSSSPS